MALWTDGGRSTRRGFILCLLLCSLIGPSTPGQSLAGQKGLVRIGAFDYFPALFRDSDGTIRGFYVDALADLAKRENLRIEYVYGSWAEGLERIQADQIDVLTSAAYTPERAEFLDYSQTPLLTVWGELYVPIASELDHITKLQGKKVAVAKGKNPELLALLDRYLLDWHRDEHSVYQQARQQWLHGRPAQTPGLPPWLLAALTGFALITLLAAAFILLLRNRVQRVTEAIAQREASLRDSIQMKRLLLDSSAEGIYGLDLEGTCTFCNASCLKLLGFEEQEQLIGRNMHEFLSIGRSNSATNREQNSTVLEPSGDFRTRHTCNETFRRADGSLLPVEYWAYPIDRDGQQIGSVVTFVDIRERVQLDASYRFISQCGYQRSGESFFPGLARHLAETLKLDCVFVSRLTDAGRKGQTVVVYQQGQTEENFEYPLQDSPCAEAMQHNICYFSRGVRQLFPEAPLLQKLEAESYIAATLWGFDGAPIGQIVAIDRAPLNNAQTAEAILKLVSLRASGELECMQAAEALRQKNIEIERFTYAVSHDLRSPLVTIKTFLGYLQADIAGKNEAAIKKDLGYIEAAAEKMSALLDELLRMSRVGRQVNAPTRVPFVDLAQEALTTVAGAIEKRGVEIRIFADPAVLFGDRPRLVQVWQNLIDNAVKYMGGQPCPRIDIGCRNKGPETIFYVRDNGIGIDSRHAHKVFGLFEKLDPQTPGTGLGLALVKKMVELYSGRIWLESEGPGQGSCFLFTLPEAFNPKGEQTL